MNNINTNKKSKKKILDEFEEYIKDKTKYHMK